MVGVLKFRFRGPAGNVRPGELKEAAISLLQPFPSPGPLRVTIIFQKK